MLNIVIISFQDNTDIIGAKYIHSFLIAHNYKSYLILQPHPDSKSDNAIFQLLIHQGPLRAKLIVTA